ncbi:hypothetical protein H8959_010818 [Pygathrix nigripes]
MLKASSPVEKPGALDCKQQGQGGDNGNPLLDPGHSGPSASQQPQGKEDGGLLMGATLSDPHLSEQDGDVSTLSRWQSPHEDEAGTSCFSPPPGPTFPGSCCLRNCLFLTATGSQLQQAPARRSFYASASAPAVPLVRTVQDQVDKKTFLHYDCGNKTVTPVSTLGKKLNVTKTWKAQNPVLREVVDMLTEQLLDIQRENYMPREPLTLQAWMSCEQKAKGHSSGSWQFSLDGQIFLLFDSQNRMWTTVHPGARKMKEKWENDKDVTMSFHYISMRDCTRWLGDFLMGIGSTLEPSAGDPELADDHAWSRVDSDKGELSCCWSSVGTAGLDQEWIRWNRDCHLHSDGCFSQFEERLNTHSLCYNFTIIRLPRHGQQWCEVQGQVDQENFLSYDCGSDKVLSMGHLEEQLDATDAWGKQLEMLGEVGQRLRLELTDTELEDFTPSGPLTLQARMSCEYETDRRIRGSQQFGFVGQKFLLFDSNNRKWTVVQARARQMKEKWEDSGLTMFFQVFSIGDCKSWLRDFLMHRKKRLEPIGNCQDCGFLGTEGTRAAFSLGREEDAGEPNFPHVRGFSPPQDVHPGRGPSPAEEPKALVHKRRGLGGDDEKLLARPVDPQDQLSGIYGPPGPSGSFPEASDVTEDTHCLCYDFTITPKFRPEPQWCEVQGQVDKRPFLHCDCVNHKAKTFASLGKKVNVTKAWEEQTETPRDVVDFLKEQLPDI